MDGSLILFEPRPCLYCFRGVPLCLLESAQCALFRVGFTDRLLWEQNRFFSRGTDAGETPREHHEAQWLMDYGVCFPRIYRVLVLLCPPGSRSQNSLSKGGILWGLPSRCVCKLGSCADVPQDRGRPYTAPKKHTSTHS